VNEEISTETAPEIRRTTISKVAVAAMFFFFGRAIVFSRFLMKICLFPI